MCLYPMKIKAVRAASPSIQFVPCGKCDSCRRAEKTGWSFRLGLELQKCIDNGWELGFCTLTYNKEHVPKIPFECFRYGYEFTDMMCFDKNQMRKFIRNLRTKLFDLYHVVGCVYFLGSEFGGRGTKRPHYHFLISYPPKKINYRQMHGLIKSLWVENGFIFPEFPDPTRVYDGELEKSFKVDVSKGAYLCAKYVTKYVCKDIGFSKYLEKCSFVTRDAQGVKVPKINLFGVLETEKDGTPIYETAYQVFKRCRPFHIQSRSLGWSYFQNMRDIDKLTVLKQGVKFLGEEHRQKLPVYIKNKLIFDNKYILKYDRHGEEKRLVLREANKFFLENADRIFDLKVQGYAKLFDSMQEETFWTTRKASLSTYHLAKGALGSLHELGMSNNDIARCYLAYYKVPYKYCYDYDSLCLVWLQRYYDQFKFIDVPLIERRFKNDFDYSLTTILYCLSMCSTADDEMTKKVTQYKIRKKQRCLENVNL